MVRTTKILVALAALLASACSADVTSSEGLLAEVDEATVTDQLLYMHDMSPVPMTVNDLEALGVDPANAIPVRVEIFDTIAVAWFAPEGEAIIDRDYIVALWEVVDRGTPLRDETFSPEQPTPVINPGEIVVGQYNVQAELGLDLEVGQIDQGAAGVAIINWHNKAGTQEELRMMRLLQTHHTGC